VRLLHTPAFAGVPSAATFAPYPRHGHGLRRVCVHAALHFADPVTGPLLLGAGRYFGIGLCRPREREAVGR
jgi:CRISPR-associated protein Csb2